jgi:hypothetical protein
MRIRIEVKSCFWDFGSALKHLWIPNAGITLAVEVILFLHVKYCGQYWPRTCIVVQCPCFYASFMHILHQVYATYCIIEVSIWQVRSGRVWIPHPALGHSLLPPRPFPLHGRRLRILHSLPHPPHRSRFVSFLLKTAFILNKEAHSSMD